MYLTQLGISLWKLRSDNIHAHATALRGLAHTKTAHCRSIPSRLPASQLPLPEIWSTGRGYFRRDALRNACKRIHLTRKVRRLARLFASEHGYEQKGH